MSQYQLNCEDDAESSRSGALYQPPVFDSNPDFNYVSIHPTRGEAQIHWGSFDHIMSEREPTAASDYLDAIDLAMLEAKGPGIPPALSTTQESLATVHTEFDTTGQVPRLNMKPRLTSTPWEDEQTMCFLVEARGICVLRREDNNWINGTKLLNVAGVRGGRRDGILKSEKQRHIVKTGPMHCKGVWIPYDKALEFANKERITDILYPLFLRDIRALLNHPITQPATTQAAAATAQREPELLNDTKPYILTGLITPSITPNRGNTRGEIDTNRGFPQEVIIDSETEESPAAPPRIQDSVTDRRRSRRPPIPEHVARTAMACRRISRPGFLAEDRRIRAPLRKAIEQRKSQQLLPTARMKPEPTPPPQPPLAIDNDTISSPGKPLLVESVQREENSDEEGVGTHGDHSAPNANEPAEASMSSNMRPGIASSGYFESEFSSPREKAKDYHIVGDVLSPSQQSPQSDSESSSGSELGLFTKFERKGLLLDRVMGYFFELFSSCRSPVPIMMALGSEEAGCTGINGHSDSSQNTTNGTARGSNVPDSSTGSRSGGKRVHEDDDSDGDESRPDKRVRLSGSGNTAPRRMACPYFKNDPEHPLLARSCSGPGWVTVHRLKEHLDRNHALPPSCVRCYATFKTDLDRDAHMRSEGQCEIKERPPRMHGFDPSQRDQLKTRPKGYKQMSQTQKWCHIYMILFPETAVTDVPSPFYEFRSLRDPSHPIDPMVEYETFLRREMPDRVRQQLALRIEDALDPIEETLRGQIVDIVRDVQLELFRSFRASIGATPLNDNLRQEAAVTETNSNTADQVKDSGGGDVDTQEFSVSGPTDADMLHQFFSAQSDWEEQMQAYQPIPPLDFSPVDFNGELFDFSSLVNAPAPPDSAYETISISWPETDKDAFLQND